MMKMWTGHRGEWKTSKLKISESIVDKSSATTQLTSLVHSGGYLQDYWTLFIRGQLLSTGVGKVDYDIDLRLSLWWLGVMKG